MALGKDYTNSSRWKKKEPEGINMMNKSVKKGGIQHELSALAVLEIIPLPLRSEDISTMDPRFKVLHLTP